MHHKNSEDKKIDQKNFNDWSAGIANRIQVLLDKKGLDNLKLAELTGESEEEIKVWLSGNYDFSLGVLSRIEKALGANIVMLPFNKNAEPDVPKDRKYTFDHDLLAFQVFCLMDENEGSRKPVVLTKN